MKEIGEGNRKKNKVQLGACLQSYMMQKYGMKYPVLITL